MLSDIYIGMILSILLGSLIGAQREMKAQKNNRTDFAGFRTFTFISLLGYLIGFLSFEVLNNINIFLIILVGVLALIISSYFIVLKVNKTHVGITTQITAIITFFIGTLISLKFYQIPITLAIIITTILALGPKLHNFAKKIKTYEVFATLKFAIISLVILPILPNKNYTLLDFPLIGELLKNQDIISPQILSQLDVFNFYYLWLMVVFISGIAFVGYILMRTVGSNNGIILTGFLGGFMSSTALTSSFSIESKKNPSFSIPLAIGVIIACSTMFFRVIFEVLVLNPSLANGIILSLGFMGIVGIVLSFFLWHKNSKSNHLNKEFNTKSPFSLGPAFKFAGLFLFILFVTKYLSVVYGNSGIYLISFISGITDVDAITITLSRLALEGSITNLNAQMGIVLAAISNTIFKGGIAYYLGSRDYFKRVALVFAIILLVGIISLIL